MSDDLREYLDMRLRESMSHRPESFVYFDYDEAQADAERLATLAAWPWEEPIPLVPVPPIQANSITMLMSTDLAVAYGMEPPEGYVPWTPPPLTLRQRLRYACTRVTTRVRIRLASAIAGFDVEHHCD